MRLKVPSTIIVMVFVCSSSFASDLVQNEPLLQERPVPREPARALEVPATVPGDLPQANLIYSLGDFVSTCGDVFEVAFEYAPDGTSGVVLYDQDGNRVSPVFDPEDQTLGLEGTKSLNTFRPSSTGAVEGQAYYREKKKKHRRRPSRIDTSCDAFGKKKKKR